MVRSCSGRCGVVPTLIGWPECGPSCASSSSVSGSPADATTVKTPVVEDEQ